MNIDNHPIDQLFKEKLGNLEQTPRFGLLADINQEIISRGKVRRMNQLKTVFSAAAAILLILMAGLYTINQNPEPKNEFSQQVRKNSSEVQQNAEKSATLQQNQANSVAIQTPATAKIATNAGGNKPTIAPVIKNKAARSSVAESIPAEVPQTAPSLASAEQVKDSDANTKGTNQSTSESAKKKSTPFTINSQPKNNSYYADNSGNTPREKKSTVMDGLWSLKAEISETFTAMLSGGSSAGTDTKSLTTIGGGMVASYKISDKLSISSGIRFSQMKQGSHSIYALNNTSGIIYLQPVEKSGNLTRDISLSLPATSSIVYSNGMSTTVNNLFVSDIAQEFKYLEIPIQATYKLIDKKISLGLTGGISTNFLVGNFASVTENGILLSSGNTDNIRNVLYSGSAGIELGYDLGNKLRLTIEPRVKQFMHSVSSNDLLNIKPMQMGIFTGLAYSF